MASSAPIEVGDVVEVGDPDNVAEFVVEGALPDDRARRLHAGLNDVNEAGESRG